MASGRKRGDEYKNRSANAFVEITDEEMSINFIIGLQSFRSILTKKSRKSYPNSVHLLVYYNVSDFEEYETFFPAVKEIVDSVDHRFKSIEILRGNEVFSFHKKQSSTSILEFVLGVICTLWRIEKIIDAFEKLIEVVQGIGVLLSPALTLPTIKINAFLNRLRLALRNTRSCSRFKELLLHTFHP